MKEPTDNELLILGLIAEMPRHGYELEHVIETRGMREWTRIGFSSIYFVLGKLEKRGYILSEHPGTGKARKCYRITESGREVLVNQTVAALQSVKPVYPSLLMGMIHLSVLTKEQALEALSNRKQAVAAELERMESIHFEQQPLPDHVDIMFDFSIGQLEAEAEWIENTLLYLETKSWIY